MLVETATSPLHLNPGGMAWERESNMPFLRNSDEVGNYVFYQHPIPNGTGQACALPSRRDVIFITVGERSVAYGVRESHAMLHTLPGLL